MARSSAPIDVEPEIIESDIATQSTIERRLAELGETAHAMLGQYGPHEIASRQDHIDSKRARAQAKKDTDRIKAEGREMTAAVDRWSQGVKNAVRQLAAPLEAVYAEYGERVSEYEDGVVEARRDKLRERYEEFAPALALPAEGADAALVPFDRLWERYAKAEKWANYGTNDVKAERSLEAVVDGIAQGERNIDALVSERDRADVKAQYFRTLSLDAAMARAGELAEARARVEAMEAERAAWAAQADQAPEVEPERDGAAPGTWAPQVEPEPEEGPVRLTPAPTVRQIPYEPPRIVPAPGAPRPVDTRAVMTSEGYDRLYEAVHGTPAPRPAPRPEEPLPTSRAATWVFMARCTAAQAGELDSICERIGVSRHKSFDGGTRKYRLVPVKE